MRRKITMLMTPGGGLGLLPLISSLRKSEKYDARIILADSNPASGNLYLPDVDTRYQIPLCSREDFIPRIVKLLETERVDYYYSGLDEEMPVLARNRDRIQATGCKILLPGAAPLENSLNKKEAYRAVSGVVAAPETYYLEEKQDWAGLYDHLGGKLLIKAVASRGSRHIYVPEDREEYLFYLRKVRRIADTDGIHFMIQKLVSGNEYNVTSLHDLNGMPVYAVSRRKFDTTLLKSPTNAAVIERRDDVIDSAMRVIKAMGLIPGFNNCEFIVSSEDDTPYFIEVNGGRTAAQDMNVVASGINMTDLMIDVVEGIFIKAIPHPPNGTAILKIKQDVVVQLEQIAKIPKV